MSVQKLTQISAVVAVLYQAITDTKNQQRYINTQRAFMCADSNIMDHGRVTWMRSFAFCIFFEIMGIGIGPAGRALVVSTCLTNCSAKFDNIFIYALRIMEQYC